MYAESLDLVCADAGERRGRSQGQIEPNGGLIKRAHGQDGRVAPDKEGDAATRKAEGRHERVSAAGQPTQLRRRRFEVGGFMEDRAIKSKGLIGAQAERAGIALADLHGLGSGQPSGKIVRRPATAKERLFEGALVDARGLDIETETGAFEKMAPDGAG